MVIRNTNTIGAARRSLAFALALIAAAFLPGVGIARAANTVINAGPIGNGQYLSATIPPGDTYEWTFSETAGNHGIIASFNTPDTRTQFDFWAQIYNPDGTLLASTTSWPGARLGGAMNFAQSGTYTLLMKAYSTVTHTGDVAVNLNLSNMPFTVAPLLGSGPILYSGAAFGAPGFLCHHTLL